MLMTSFLPERNLLLVVAFLRVVGVSAQHCNLCADGSQANLNGILLDGSLCRDINHIALKTPRDDIECFKIQNIGYQSCSCPTQPTQPNSSAAACRICPDGSTMANADTDIVGLNATCGSIEGIAHAFLGQSACHFLPQLASYCGCSNVEPTCTACSNRLPVSKPQVTVSELGTTCGFLDQLASLAPNQTACNDFQAAFREATAENDACGCVTTADNIVVQPTTSPTTKPIASDTPTPFSSPTLVPTQGTEMPRAASANPTLVATPIMHPTKAHSFQPNISPFSSPTPTHNPTTNPQTNPPSESDAHVVIPEISNDIGTDSPTLSPTLTAMPTSTPFLQPEPASLSSDVSGCSVSISGFVRRTIVSIAFTMGIKLLI